MVSEWEKSPAGQYVGNYLREVLCTSWRDVPAVYFGDSGSLNKFKRSCPSMLSYCSEWLRRPMGKIRDFIAGGANVVDWVKTFTDNRDAIAPPNQVASYKPEDLMKKGWGTVRPDALTLQEENVWFASLFNAHGHLAPNNVFVVVDCMNSGIAETRPRTAPDRVRWMMTTSATDGTATRKS